MGTNTTIAWTNATWNPTTGCTTVSPGCDNCYARTFAERWRGTAGHYFERGFDVMPRPNRLDQPHHWRRPRKIFVNSMSDLFHDAIPDEYIARVFAVMAATPQHTYQLLTKRHGRMRSLLGGLDGSGHRLIEAAGLAGAAAALYEAAWPLPNLWLGVSAENQECANRRIPSLLDTPAAVRWVSAEPLLGPIRLGLADKDALVDGGIDWVVCGGESGPGARPMHPDWARQLRDECAEHRIPYLFKQWGEWTPEDAGAWTEDDGTPRGAISVLDQRGASWTGTPRLAPDDAERMRRVGRRRSGRELDGRTWTEYPVMAP